MTYRVLNLADTSWCPEALAPLAGVAEVVTRPATRAALLAELPTADAYLATLHVRADAAALALAPRLRAIATPSTGLDHLDLDAAARQGIAVLSLREETAFLDSITATAELTWALLLAVQRRLPWAHAAATAGDWARDRFRGRQLAGRTLGILGYGRLGRIVAEYGKAFRLRVLACDVRPVTPAPGVELVDFATLLRESDILSIHIHLTEANRGLIGRDALTRLKPGACLLNTSRGAIVDEAALLDALASGRLAAAGVDVLHGEWDARLAEHPLVRYARTHENLVITPHIGGVTVESQVQTLTFIAGKLADHLRRLRG